MHGGEMLIPILVPLGFFAMIFGIVYMKTKENLAILEKGKDPRSPRPYRNLKWGLLLVGSGVGLLLAYILDRAVFHSIDDNPSVYMSLIGIGGGLGLVLSYRIEKKEVLDKIDVNTHF